MGRLLVLGRQEGGSGWAGGAPTIIKLDLIIFSLYPPPPPGQATRGRARGQSDVRVPATWPLFIHPPSVLRRPGAQPGQSAQLKSAPR